MVSKRPRIEAKHLIRDDDLPWLRVTSDTPVACQIDGDYLGPRDDDDVHGGSGCAGRGGTTRKTAL